MLKHGILGLLNYGDMTGYEIMTVFRDSLSHFGRLRKARSIGNCKLLKKKVG